MPLQLSVAFSLCVLVCQLLAPVTAGAASPTEDAVRPNIVFIFADDVGQEVLGCYGGTSYATPHLDRLASVGIRFRHAYAMPMCHPSRICLLTGRYPLHVGNPAWGSFPQELESQTLAHVLKKAGYATAVSGKWQLTLQRKKPQHPRTLGFDESCVFGWHEGPRYYRPLIWQNGELRPELAEKYGPDVYVDFLIRFMERNRERPFFAFYSMAFCHDVSNDFEIPVPRGPKGRYDSFKEMAEGMDERVGRIVSALDRLDLRKRTLFLYTTDNGTAAKHIATAKGKQLITEEIVSMAKGREVRGGKGQLTDAGTRVPMLANWPGTIAPGQVVDDLVDLSDFLPTFAALAGAPSPAGVKLDGHSFVGRLLRGEASRRTWAFAQARGRFFVRTQQYKLYSDGRLFDVAADREEQTALDRETLDPEARAVARELELAVQALSASGAR